MSTALQIDTQLRAANLEDLVGLLRKQKDVAFDVVVPAHDLRYENGRLHIKDAATKFDAEGVSLVDAVLDPTPIFEDGVADRLKLPREYLRRIREEKTVLAHPIYSGVVDIPLLDANVNAHLQSFPASKRFLIRAFRTDNPDEIGIARSIHSNRFGLIDNLDVTLASLKGIADAGLDPSTLNIRGDLSERKFRLVVVAPEITALAPVLLANYRNPFGEHGRRGRVDEGHGFVADATGERLPIVEAGFCITNSETGGGAYWRYPYVTVRTCGNGAVYKVDGLSNRHAGSTLDDGVIEWGDDTRRNALEAIVLQTRDAVKTWLTPEYVAKVVAEVEETCGIPIEDVPATLERVAKAHLFTESEQATILDLFIKGGDVTAGGVFQAVTAAAQVIDNPDRAAELEECAFDVLATAAAVV
jgi:hypothetical protein